MQLHRIVNIDLKHGEKTLILQREYGRTIDWRSIYNQYTEGSHRGLVHHLGKVAYRKVSRVRISPLPQTK